MENKLTVRLTVQQQSALLKHLEAVQRRYEAESAAYARISENHPEAATEAVRLLHEAAEAESLWETILEV